MKVLLITQAATIKRTWGITKVVIDASEAMDKAGASCELFPPHSIEASSYESRLYDHLEATLGRYDIIEIPDTLPFGINPHRFAKRVVVRSVLLPLHCRYLRIRTKPTTLRSRLRHVFQRRKIEQRKAVHMEMEIATVKARLGEADLVNVANSRDREILIREGIAPEKILVLPYGLNVERQAALNAIPRLDCERRRKNLVFVGTFDFRKGCLDVVEVFRRYAKVYPEARLQLLGTRGLMTSVRQVLQFFPRALRKHVSVVESFTEEELPPLLAEADVGLFPSYWEGFGISVVEQLAAGIPVIAYDSPGPCDILPPKWLVQPGDVETMTQRLIALAEHRDPEEARAIAKYFSWAEIGRQTVAAYQQALESI